MHIVSYCIKWVKTSWKYGTKVKLLVKNKTYKIVYSMRCSTKLSSYKPCHLVIHGQVRNQLWNNIGAKIDNLHQFAKKMVMKWYFFNLASFVMHETERITNQLLYYLRSFVFAYVVIKGWEILSSCPTYCPSTLHLPLLVV